MDDFNKIANGKADARRGRAPQSDNEDYLVGYATGLKEGIIKEYAQEMEAVKK